MAKIPDFSQINIPSGAWGWLKDWVSQVVLWGQTRDPANTTVGDPLDKFVARSELVKLGVVSRSSDGAFNLASGLTGGTTVVTTTATVPDLTPPPTPTGLSVTAGLSYIYIEWTAPSYALGHGHFQTLIYGAIWVTGTAAPTFGDVRTKLIDSITGPGTTDAYASPLNTTWCIWIKFQSVDGVVSTDPAGGINGVQATTGQDVSSLLTALSGSLTSSELGTTLRTRINLIDAPTTGLVTKVSDLTTTYGSTANAATSAAAAAAAQSAAIAAQAAALISQGAAAGSASASSTSAGLASNSATAAGGSATAAASSATSASSYSTAAGTASTAATNASISAGSYRDAASGYATAASTSAGTASTKATDAGTSATAASSSATTATTKAGEASTSATNAASSASGASGSATTASTQAGLATTANTNAGIAAAAALVSQNASATSASNASGSAVSASSTLTNINSVVAGAASAAVLTETNARIAADNTISAQYAVKLDVNGYVSGFGLMSSLLAGTTPTSTFLVSVDKFAVMTPTSSVVNWIAGTTYALNDIRGVAGNTDKVLVCKLAGTASTTAPAIAGAIGAMLTDGDVKWQIASRVPFSVLTSSTTINGVSVPAGVYIDGAYMLNATIGNAQIGNGTIDNQKIADLSVDKLTGSALKVGSYIQSTNYTSGANGTGFRINADGTAELQAASVRGLVTASQIDARGLSIKDASGNIILAAGTALAAANITPAAGWLNSGITIAANGALSGGGGGAVTIGGLGYSGSLTATNGATWGTNVSGQPSDANILNTYVSSGANMAYNGSFDNWNSASGYPDGWGFHSGYNIYDRTETINWVNYVGDHGVNLAGYFPPGCNVFWNYSQDANLGGGAYYEYGSNNIAVVPGKKYCLSAYVGAHRCVVYVALRAYNASGGLLQDFFAQSSSIESQGIGGTSLGGYNRASAVGVIPAGTAYVRIFLRKSGTLNSGNSYMFITRVQLEEVGADATGPGPWSDGGVLDTSTVRGANRITPANASTYIADLAVDTLQIAGNAVTVPCGVYTADLPAAMTTPGEYLVQSLTMPCTGSPVTVFAGFSIFVIAGGGDRQILFRVVRDSTQIAISSIYTYANTTVQIPAVFPPIVDNPSGGVNHEYKLYVTVPTSTGAAYWVWALNNGIFCIEIKK